MDKLRREKKKNFTLFSDHDGSLLRRQPGAKHKIVCDNWRRVSECKQGSTSELNEALSFLFLQPGSCLGS